MTGGVLVAGSGSGCGKTTVSLGLMAALARRGHDVRPFKCGPDFIDPSLHRLVTGRISRNLDLRMCGPEHARRCLAENAASGLAVVEGVMGLFDGGEGSAASLARLLGLPVLLVLDVRGQAESVAAVVQGFATLDAAPRVAGVICNRVGGHRHQELIARAIVRQGRVELLGFLPRDEEIAIGSRHLGLRMGGEEPLSAGAIDRLVGLMESHLDLDRIVALAAEAGFGPAPEPPGPGGGRGFGVGPAVRIGLARDEAFCFYYEDNLDLLRRAGAELIEFSPLRDRALPQDLAGLYLGGGYPELHASTLSANQGMLAAVRAWSAAGRPLLAECGGFMYLCAELEDLTGQIHPMAGVFPGRCVMQGRLASLGYREARLVGPCPLGRAGAVLRGHEFHYSVLRAMDEAVPRVMSLEHGRSEGYLVRNTLAGYVHFHFGATPEAARYFVDFCGGQNR